MDDMLTIDPKKFKKGGYRKFSQRILAVAGLTPTKKEQPGTPRRLGLASPRIDVIASTPDTQKTKTPDTPLLDREDRASTFSTVGGDWRSSAMESVPSLNPVELQKLLSSVAHPPTSQTNVCMDELKREKLGRHYEALKSHPPFHASVEDVDADSHIEAAQASPCDEDEATLAEDSTESGTGYATSIESVEPIEPVLSAGGESLASTETISSYGPPIHQVLVGNRNKDRKGENRLVHVWGLSLTAHKASSKLRKRSLQQADK